MPRFSTLEAREVAAGRAHCLLFAATAWPSDHRLTVTCRTPLQVLVLANEHVLIHSYESLLLLLGRERFDVVKFVHFSTPLGHALDPQGFSALDTGLNMVFCAVFAESVLARK